MNKAKGKHAERIRVFWVGIYLRIHRVCVCGLVVCVHISRVYVRMHKACVRIQTQNTKTQKGQNNNSENKI